MIAKIYCALQKISNTITCLFCDGIFFYRISKSKVGGRGGDDSPAAATGAAALPKPVLRSAFGRAGKHHAPPETAPTTRAARTTAKMAAETLKVHDAAALESTGGRAGARRESASASDDTDDQDEFRQQPEMGSEEDIRDILAGVEGAETELAKPALLSSR